MNDSERNRLTRRSMLGWLTVTPVALAGCGASSGATDAGDAARASSDASPPSEDASRPDGGPAPDVGSTPDATPEDAAVVDAGREPDAAASCEPTRPDAEGPFFEPGAPSRTELAPDEPGEPLEIRGTVVDADCTPLPGALLDVWQADAEGNYHDAGAEWRLRAQMTTDDQGRYHFTTIKPGRYPLAGSTRPAHIHFMVSHPGLQPVTTQLYFEGDPFLAPNDPCNAGCDSGDPARIIELVEDGDRLVGTFDIVLGD